MARYISLIRFADQGIRNIKDTVKRGDAARAEAEKWASRSSRNTGRWERTMG